ncbi:hypothetical protein PHLCEN_2v7596 [Hermanssonia centrifuga]|uniref:Glycosyl hydrolase family 95 N-terminal domain-containing protein n=1 Tax=Hermanssonia centrifuga TaxID=98765 RepID=A0A2R6NW36_9APHY|nr:hypothetical protein PHLCEN_2v7596 [Hermanssonia centrifuga]
MAADMQAIRQAIFQSSTGTIDRSYSGAGYLVTSLNITGDVSKYARWLDLDQAVARTTWNQDDISFSR